MKLIDQCKTCKANQNGHCIKGNDAWKAIVGNANVKCEYYSSKY